MTPITKILLGIIIVGGAIWALTSLSNKATAPTTPNQNQNQNDGEVGNEVPEDSEGSYKDLIKVDSPKAQQTVSSPLTFSGEARGTWYFEATFPVRLVDRNGTELGVGYAQATDEWMTPNYVPFTGQIIFTLPATSDEATLIFEKSNPSGLDANADEYRVPVKLNR